MIKTRIVMIAAFAVGLSGCLTVPEETAGKIKAASLQICQTSDQLEAAYVVLKEDGLKPNLVDKGDIAFAAMNRFCASSQDWDPGNAALQAALLYVQIAAVMKSAT